MKTRYGHTESWNYGVSEAWGQSEEKPADLKAGGCSETWLRVMETEALPSITSAKLEIYFETTK